MLHMKFRCIRITGSWEEL